MKFPLVLCSGTGSENFPNSNKTGIFTVLNLEDLSSNGEIQNFNISASINFWAISYDNYLLIYTKDFENDVFEPKNRVKKVIKFDSNIESLCSNDKRVLILLQNHEFHQYDVVKGITTKLNFLNVIVADVESSSKEYIVLFACGNAISVAVSNLNYIYNIPNRTYQLEQHVKLKKVCCGNEHCLLLSRNGDVSSWGTGLRGQLGHGEILNEEQPRLIEALAGIKIIDVAAGGWHSAALSAFGDLYTWGWNSHGQLGLRMFKGQEGDLHNKNPAVYTLPKLIEAFDDENCEELQILEVSCGSKHTIVKTESGRFYSTGSNRYQQLGLDKANETIHFQFGNTKEEIFIDKLTRIRDSNLDSNCKIISKYYSSIWLVQCSNQS